MTDDGEHNPDVDALLAALRASMFRRDIEAQRAYDLAWETMSDELKQVDWDLSGRELHFPLRAIGLKHGFFLTITTATLDDFSGTFVGLLQHTSGHARWLQMTLPVDNEGGRLHRFDAWDLTLAKAQRRLMIEMMKGGGDTFHGKLEEKS
jgi:hypothetical protein